MSGRITGIHLSYKNFVILIVGSVLLFVVGCGTPRGNAISVSNFQISGGVKPGPLSIQRVQLNFDGGLSSITVKKGNEIEASAQIKYQGTGVMSASWLVDEIIVEQVNISLSHGSLLTLSPKKSTQIPSFKPGQHYLRLQINHPRVEFKQPKLKYFVVNQ